MFWTNWFVFCLLNSKKWYFFFIWKQNQDKLKSFTFLFIWIFFLVPRWGFLFSPSPHPLINNTIIIFFFYLDYKRGDIKSLGKTNVRKNQWVVKTNWFETNWLSIKLFCNFLNYYFSELLYHYIYPISRTCIPIAKSTLSHLGRYCIRIVWKF